MSDEYVALVDLEINGAAETNVKSVEESEREIAIPVNLMKKTGFAKKTARYSLVLKYVPPATGARDWDTLADATITLAYEGGERVIYSGCRTGKVGSVSTDGEKEKEQDITILATSRKVE